MLREQSRLVRVATPELQRGGLNVKSAFNAGAPSVSGVEPSYQDIRTLDLEQGRQLNWEDERQVHRVAILGDDIFKQLFGGRDGIGQPITINGVGYTVVGRSATRIRTATTAVRTTTRCSCRSRRWPRTSRCRTRRRLTPCRT